MIAMSAIRIRAACVSVGARRADPRRRGTTAEDSAEGDEAADGQMNMTAANDHRKLRSKR